MLHTESHALVADAAVQRFLSRIYQLPLVALHGGSRVQIPAARPAKSCWSRRRITPKSAGC